MLVQPLSFEAIKTWEVTENAEQTAIPFMYLYLLKAWNWLST